MHYLSKFTRLLWNYRGPADPGAGLEQTGPNAKRQRIEHVRRTIARPVVAQGVHALVGQFQSHLVRQDGHGQEKVGAGCERLHPGSQRMSVALHLNLFEVERVVAQARRPSK